MPSLPSRGEGKKGKKLSISTSLGKRKEKRKDQETNEKKGLPFPYSLLEEKKKKNKPNGEESPPSTRLLARPWEKEGEKRKKEKGTPFSCQEERRGKRDIQKMKKKRHLSSLPCRRGKGAFYLHFHVGGKKGEGKFEKMEGILLLYPRREKGSLLYSSSLLARKRKKRRSTFSSAFLPSGQVRREKGEKRRKHTCNSLRANKEKKKNERGTRVSGKGQGEGTVLFTLFLLNERWKKREPFPSYPFPSLPARGGKKKKGGKAGP